MKELIFVTGNQNKLLEAQEILRGYKVINKKIDLPELQETPENIIREKLKIAYEQVKKPLFVEDTGLFFNAMDGLPGVYIKHFIKLGPQGLYNMFSSYEDKSATSRCMIGYHDGTQTHVMEGVVEGTIVAPRGESKFGFDPIFQPKGFDKTFAEMSPEEKNGVSHRKRALERLLHSL